MSPEYLLIIAAGFFAAVMNSVAGGGTMLSFPALLAAGLPPVLANTTNSVALFFGMPGSVWAFRRRLFEVRHWILPLGIVSFFAGLLGAVLLLAIPSEVFDFLVPWLLLFATALFLIQGRVQRSLKRRRQVAQDTGTPLRPTVRGVVIQFFVSLYGGFFGAGIGIMMLAGLGMLGLRDIHQMNALKALLAMLTKLSAVVYFIVMMQVNWPLALCLLGGSIPGYYFGSHFAQRIPAVWVRAIVVAIGLGIALHLLWQRYSG